MRAIIRTFFVLSLTLVFGVSISNAEGPGLRIEAEIPFEFTIGSKTYPAGKYDLSLVRLHGPVHSVRLRDETGKVICNTTAIQNGSTIPDRSDMLFAVVDDQHFLDRIRTPDVGFAFSKSSGDKRVAKAKRVTVPTSGSTPN